MTIRFACSKCGHTMRVRSPQAGPTRCPHCGRLAGPLRTVPLETATNEPPGAEQDDAAAPPSAVEPDFRVQLVYDSGSQRPDSSRVAQDAGRVVVSRGVLYVQGLLLGAVAFTAFALGTLAGRDAVPPAPSPAAEGPYELSGRVFFEAHAGLRPDAGAIVIAVPREQPPPPNERVSADGLRPGDPSPPPDAPAHRPLRIMGGAYTQVNADGQYRLELPEEGAYFVLIVSAHRTRGPADEWRRKDVAEIGRYVFPPTEILGERTYVWQAVFIDRHQTLDAVFP